MGSKKWRDAMVNAGDGSKAANMTLIRGCRFLIWKQNEQAINLVEARKLDWPLALPAAKTEMVTYKASGERKKSPTQTEVVEVDMLEVACELAAQGKRVALLNMACAHCPGGGYERGAGAQEETLMRRTDLYRYIVAQKHAAWQNGRYCIPEASCLLSKDVTVMRGTEEKGYPFIDPKSMPKITIVSCAAPDHPRLGRADQFVEPDYASETERSVMRNKIAGMLRAAESTGCDVFIASAFGCGAFKNPPTAVANLFRDELEYSTMERAVFCILNDHNAGGKEGEEKPPPPPGCHNPQGNFMPFEKVFG